MFCSILARVHNNSIRVWLVGSLWRLTRPPISQTEPSYRTSHQHTNHSTTQPLVHSRRSVTQHQGLYDDVCTGCCFSRIIYRDVVSVLTSRSRDQLLLRLRSRLGLIGKRLGLGLGTDRLGLSRPRWLRSRAQVIGAPCRSASVSVTVFLQLNAIVVLFTNCRLLCNKLPGGLKE